MLFYQDNLMLYKCVVAITKVNELGYKSLSHSPDSRFQTPATICCFQISRNNSVGGDFVQMVTSSLKWLPSRFRSVGWILCNLNWEIKCSFVKTWILFKKSRTCPCINKFSPLTRNLDGSQYTCDLLLKSRNHLLAISIVLSSQNNFFYKKIFQIVYLHVFHKEVRKFFRSLYALGKWVLHLFPSFWTTELSGDKLSVEDDDIVISYEWWNR